MQKVGYLKPGHKESGESYRGQISTLDVNTAITLLKNLKRKSDKSPDFEVFGEGKQKHMVKIGAVWKKQGREKQFLSLKIDDPSLPEALSLKAFKEEDESWSVYWERQG